MKTIKTVMITPIFGEFIPPYGELKDNCIYISETYKTSTHKCFCGCGEIVILPFGEFFWKLENQNNKITISPSVGSFNLKCKSHYIITRNKANFV